ncbi:MAG: hypothetical protein H6634_10845 [Anaerolineales bacterium]|nr:hypothetical protein [Anaerolineales bacterium]
MKNVSHQQITFLLKIWYSNSEWRISIESPITGERNGFTKLEAFIEFLKSHIESQPAIKKLQDELNGENVK